MRINEAVKTALESATGMRRAAWPAGFGSIYPSNTSSGCVILGSRAVVPFRWQPKADDLAAEDWEVDGRQEGLLCGKRQQVPPEAPETSGEAPEAPVAERPAKKAAKA